MHLALNAHTRLAANVECANALGAVYLVRRKTHQIDLQMVNIEIDLAGSLRSVAVKDNAALAAELANTGNILNDADFVIHRHDRDKRGVRANSID